MGRVSPECRTAGPDYIQILDYIRTLPLKGVYEHYFDDDMSFGEGQDE